MRLHCRQFLIIACTSFCVAPVAAQIHVTGEHERSSIRAVSISSEPAARPAAPPRSPVSQAQFLQPSTGAAATSRTSTTTRTNSTTFVAAGPNASERPGPAASNSGSTSSSLVIVKAAPRRDSAEKGWVHQAQYVPGQSIAAPPAEQLSTMTFEPVTTETLAPNYSLPANSPPVESQQAASPLMSATPVEQAPQTTTVPASPVTERTPTKLEQLVRPERLGRATGQAQMPSGNPSAGNTSVPNNVQLINQIRQAREQNALNPGRASLSQLPSRMPLRPATPTSSRQKVKPFEGTQNAPSFSPYLNLYRNEDEGDAGPNYFAFVRPQLEQQEANRNQQLGIQRLQRQLQGGAAAQSNRPTAGPETGAARFMDTAQYYSGWQR